MAVFLYRDEAQSYLRRKHPYRAAAVAAERTGIFDSLCGRAVHIARGVEADWSAWVKAVANSVKPVQHFFAGVHIKLKNRAAAAPIAGATTCAAPCAWVPSVDSGSVENSVMQNYLAGIVTICATLEALENLFFSGAADLINGSVIPEAA